MMNDNISIKKLWYDEDFYEVQIIMSTEQIRCKINTYIVDEEINALSQKILDYVKNDIGFYWEIGEEDSDSCPKIIIESFIKDISGHIVLNASCQLQSIEENAKCNYNCKFPIKTEMGLLYNFAKQLPKLNEQEVGICVAPLGIIFCDIYSNNIVQKLSFEVTSSSSIIFCISIS